MSHKSHILYIDTYEYINELKLFYKIKFVSKKKYIFLKTFLGPYLLIIFNITLNVVQGPTNTQFY